MLRIVRLAIYSATEKFHPDYSLNEEISDLLKRVDAKPGSGGATGSALLPADFRICQ